jgi:hypothetical protein
MELLQKAAKFRFKKSLHEKTNLAIAKLQVLCQQAASIPRTKMKPINSMQCRG